MRGASAPGPAASSPPAGVPSAPPLSPAPDLGAMFQPPPSQSPAFAAPPPPAARAPVPALPTVQSPPVKGLPPDAPKLVINGGVHSPDPARRRDRRGRARDGSGAAGPEADGTGPGTVRQTYTIQTDAFNGPIRPGRFGWIIAGADPDQPFHGTFVNSRIEFDVLGATVAAPVVGRFNAANLLKIGELAYFHSITPNFPA